MKISVISLWRNSGTYIEDALKRLERLERYYEMDYYFYENDSEDNTLDRLRQWLHTRNGPLISEKLNTQHYGPVVDTTRIDNFVKYRNTILSEAKPLKSDYTLLLDSDVSYDDNIVKKYLRCMTDDIAMITPNTVQNVKCKMDNCNQPSYYDSFALKDKKNQRALTWSCNPFVEENDRKNWKNKKPVVVNSAFGGIPIIRTSILNEPSVKWSVTHGSDAITFNEDFTMMQSKQQKVGCEHWNFCKAVRQFGKILVVPTIKAFTTVEGDIPDQPAFIKRQQDIIKDPWQRLVANL